MILQDRSWTQPNKGVPPLSGPVSIEQRPILYIVGGVVIDLTLRSKLELLSTTTKEYCTPARSFRMDQVLPLTTRDNASSSHTTPSAEVTERCEEDRQKKTSLYQKLLFCFLQSLFVLWIVLILALVVHYDDTLVPSPFLKFFGISLCSTLLSYGLEPLYIRFIQPTKYHVRLSVEQLQALTITAVVTQIVSVGVMVLYGMLSALEWHCLQPGKSLYHLQVEELKNNSADSPPSLSNTCHSFRVILTALFVAEAAVLILTVRAVRRLGPASILWYVLLGDVLLFVSLYDLNYADLWYYGMGYVMMFLSWLFHQVSCTTCHERFHKQVQLLIPALFHTGAVAVFLGGCLTLNVFTSLYHAWYVGLSWLPLFLVTLATGALVPRILATVSLVVGAPLGFIILEEDVSHSIAPLKAAGMILLQLGLGQILVRPQWYKRERRRMQVLRACQCCTCKCEC